MTDIVGLDFSPVNASFCVFLDKHLMKNRFSRLAPMEMASFYGGVHHKRYNEQRDKWC